MRPPNRCVCIVCVWEGDAVALFGGGQAIVRDTRAAGRRCSCAEEVVADRPACMTPLAWWGTSVPPEEFTIITGHF